MPRETVVCGAAGGGVDRIPWAPVLRDCLCAISGPGLCVYVNTVLRSFGTVRSLVVGAYAEASDDLHQLFDCVVESASKQHWRRIGARSAKEARSYFATTLRRAWGVHFAREFARHRIRRVVFVGAPRRQPGRPLATADGDWPALSAGEFAAHALRVGGAWAGGPPGRR